MCGFKTTAWKKDINIGGKYSNAFKNMSFIEGTEF
jgi:hypothetical protein